MIILNNYFLFSKTHFKIYLLFFQWSEFFLSFFQFVFQFFNLILVKTKCLLFQIFWQSLFYFYESLLFNHFFLTEGIWRLFGDSLNTRVRLVDCFSILQRLVIRIYTWILFWLILHWSVWRRMSLFIIVSFWIHFFSVVEISHASELFCLTFKGLIILIKKLRIWIGLSILNLFFSFTSRVLKAVILLGILIWIGQVGLILRFF